MPENIKIKELGVSFLKLCAVGNVDEAYAKFVAANFKHHNQWFKGDRASLIEAMKDAAAKLPNRRFEVHSVIQEGDKVMAHSHVVKDNMEIAVVHIMKFKDDRIVEMWDVGQVMSKDSPNENGMF